MKHMYRILAGSLILIAFSAAAATFLEGQDYTELSSAIRKNSEVASMLADNPKKVQLVFFFSYGCSACYNFDPGFEQWLSTQQHKNLVIYRVPVTFEEDWEMLARMYYVMQDIKPKQDLNKQIFDAIHKDGLKLWQKSAMKDFFMKHGYTAQNFETTYDSFTVNTQVKNGDVLATAYNINATPTIIINGPYDSYTTDVQQAGGEKRFYQVLDFIISKEEKKLG